MKSMPPVYMQVCLLARKECDGGYSVQEHHYDSFVGEVLREAYPKKQYGENGTAQLLSEH